MAKPKVEKMARWIVLLATFSLIAAACGSGDSSTASGSSETGTDEQDQTEQLANLCDLFTEARLA